MPKSKRRAREKAKNKIRKRLNKEKRCEQPEGRQPRRLRRRLREAARYKLADGRTVTLTKGPSNGVKMSEVLIDAASCLIGTDDLTDHPEDDVRAALSFAAMAWDLSLAPPDAREGMLKKAVAAYRGEVGDEAAEEFGGFLEWATEVVADLRERKYPGVRRFIMAHDVSFSEDGLHVNVVSTL